MRRLFALGTLSVAAALVVSQGAPGLQVKGGIVQRQVQMAKFGVKLDVLRVDSFKAQFGANPEIPRSSQAIRALSHKLFTPQGRDTINDECGEYEFGLLFAALRNPEVSDADRDAVDGDADGGIPSLPKTYTSGHFKFYYTDNNSNSDHNSSLANIQATAVILNNAWNNFVANFKKPKHYVSAGKQLIDVKCYYLGSSLYGQTNSSWNHMDLCSKKVIKDPCKRQTTPVHELFHRTQYAYGYVTGTAGMKWAVEATASWSQKHMASNVGDWMNRMNSGLGDPDKALTSRSYDACHWWTYLGQRGGSEKNTIRDCWQTYSTNGKNMVNAVKSVIKSRIGSQYDLNHVAGWWNFTNFYKDMTNAASNFDYSEDETTKVCGGITYGPLATVPRTTQTLSAGVTKSNSGSVAAYGADYYVYNLPASAKKFEVNTTASSNNFGYAVIYLKNNTRVHYSRTAAGGNKNWSTSYSFAAGAVNKVCVVVIGNPNGGSYTVNAKASS